MGDFSDGIGELLAARAGDDAAGLAFGDRRWTWRDVVAESARRAALARSLRRPGHPFHVGVLLDNGPEYVWWLGAAALAGATLVGINPTRRGDELARDIRHTDCQLLVTEPAHAMALDGLDTGVGPDRVLVTGSAPYTSLLADHRDAPLPDALPSPDSLLLLLFTSGSTGAPKAVRCTTGRLADTGRVAAGLYGFTRDDICYCAMPMFHGNALMAVWAPVLACGATFATRPRFSASGFLPDVRRFGATYFNYVGKALSYILATPELPDDADNPLQRGFGTEASARDIEAFERRFGCTLVEGYGMSEGGANIVRTPDTPRDALGVAPTPAVFVADPETGAECPRARFDADGRLVNADEAIGEIVNRDGAARFEGYYANPEAEAERTRFGWYWTGDLAYRDEAGFFWFAGRGGDRLRVDGENLAAAPVERVLSRFDGVVAVAVYPVPDPASGDAVMAAVELAPGTRFDPDALAAFLDAQPDLGTKWAPQFVRIVEEMPLTGSHKIQKHTLRRERWSTGTIWWRPDRRRPDYVPLTDADRAALDAAVAETGRTTVV